MTIDMRMSMKLSLSHLPIMIDNFSIFNISFTQAVEYCIISPIFLYFKNVDFLSTFRKSKDVAPRMNYFTKNTYIIKDVAEEYFVRGVFMEYMGNEIP